MGKQGFSMLEMTVVLVLLAGAGVFVSNLIIRGTKGQKKVSANLDFNIKMAEVLNILQDSSQCNSTTNLVFKEASGATLNTAKLTNENTPATNTVNWIGYQVGAGATAQNIKVLQEGDVLENTYTVSEITFQRQKDTAGNVVAAVNNAGKSTHPVELVITANPTSGPGFPITKLFKTTLITDTPATSPTNEVVGCHSPNVSNGKLLQIKYVQSSTYQDISSATPRAINDLFIDFLPSATDSVIEVEVSLSAFYDYVACFAIYKNGVPTEPGRQSGCGNGMNVTRYPHRDRVTPYTSGYYGHSEYFKYYEVNNSNTLRRYQVYSASGWRALSPGALSINDRKYSRSTTGHQMNSFSTLTVKEYA